MISNSELIFMVSKEAVVLRTYRDSVGVLTIGVGHTANAGGIKPVPGMTITLEEALGQFGLDVLRFDRDVNGAVHVPLTDAQRAALDDFDFNTGAIKTGSVATKLNAGMIDAAMATLQSYDKAGGRVLPGLEARRAEELRMFKTGQFPPIHAIPVYDNYPGPVRMVPVSEIDLAAVQAVINPPAPVPAVQANEPAPVQVVATTPPAQTSTMTAWASNFISYMLQRKVA